MSSKTIVTISVSIIGSIGVLVGSWCYFAPKYRVYSATMDGEAEYAQAEQNRRITVLEAESKLEAAKSLADAEVERAKGVAQANAIIGESLKNNESYLRWLWIENLDKGNNSVIYIPTEAGLPILEAGKRGAPSPK
jgi:regulator of protease activity HflC (stomatin/prohibitin superfamily)